MSQPCELYISRLYGPDDDKVVRIDAKAGARLLGRVELSLEDFAAAVMGRGAVPGAFTNEHRRALGQNDERK